MDNAVVVGDSERFHDAPDDLNSFFGDERRRMVAHEAFEIDAFDVLHREVWQPVLLGGVSINLNDVRMNQPRCQPRFVVKAVDKFFLAFRSFGKTFRATQRSSLVWRAR